MYFWALQWAWQQTSQQRSRVKETWLLPKRSFSPRTNRRWQDLYYSVQGSAREQHADTRGTKGPGFALPDGHKRFEKEGLDLGGEWVCGLPMGLGREQGRWGRPGGKAQGHEQCSMWNCKKPRWLEWVLEYQEVASFLILIYQDAPAQLFEGYIYLYQLFKNHLASNLKIHKIAVLISGYFSWDMKIKNIHWYILQIICHMHQQSVNPLWEHRSERSDSGSLKLSGLRQHLEKNGN